MAIRKNLRSRLPGDIVERNRFSRLHPEGIGFNDENCGDSGAETFTGRYDSIEDNIIKAIDSGMTFEDVVAGVWAVEVGLGQPDDYTEDDGLDDEY